MSIHASHCPVAAARLAKRGAGYGGAVTEKPLPRPERLALTTLVWRFPQVHLGLGLIGNALFVVGTLLFLSGRDHVALWFFLVGSSGMFLGAVGETVRTLGKRRLARFDVDPFDPDEQWSRTQRRSSPLE